MGSTTRSPQSPQNLARSRRDAPDVPSVTEPAARTTGQLAEPGHRDQRAVKVRLIDQTKRYGSVVAVDNVSLDVQEGEFLTLLGPSGSGKTTVLMMLAGLVAPSGGQILVDGQDATSKPPYERDMGVVFQSYALFPHMTVADNIAFPLKMRRLPRHEVSSRVTEALELVRLPDVGDRKPRQLSGGQQQRIALARALVFRPSVLLMDEPLGALDKKLREQMQVEIKRIQSSLGLTAVYVTHDQEEALTMSDRIAVMKDGRIIQLGVPVDMYERPRTPFVADFFGESNILRGVALGPTDEEYRVAIDGSGGASARDEAVQRDTSWAILMPRSAELGPRQPVVLIVRPEKIALIPAGSTSDRRNVAAGVVEEMTYAGEVTRYRVRLDAGPVFTVKQPNAHGVIRYVPGDPVTLAWHTADTVPLEEDSRRCTG